MQPKEWMDYMFDHTVIVAEDDPWVDGWLEDNGTV